MIWLMARAGLRVGEVLALQRSDVDLGGKGSASTVRCHVARVCGQ